ncbi:MAG: carbohydrate-binding protein [Chitinophagaceae bacterium]
MKKNYWLKSIGIAVCLLVSGSFYQLTAQVLTAKPNVSMTANSNGYYEYLPLGYNPANANQKYPLILFLHGMGELGTNLGALEWQGINGVIRQNKFPASFTVNNQTFSFIVITPQFIGWPTPMDVSNVLDYCVQRYNVDIGRIYITGLSMGGGVTWDYAGGSSAYANRIAAIVPIAGASWPENMRARVIATANLPVWATHNDGDVTVPAYYTNDYITQINAAPAPNPLAKKTIFQSTSHDAWSTTYNPAFKENGLNIYEWMLQYRRSTSTNPGPASFAGTAQTITLPVSQVTLTGTATAGTGNITSVSWTKLSGGNATIANPSALTTTVSNLTAGTYVFRLSVTQTDNQTRMSDVSVFVNPAIIYKNIPGKIEAESWDAKSGPFYAVATTDAGGGQQVIGISNGSAMDYNVNVAQAGTYTAKFRIATPQLNAQFQIKLGNTLLGTINIPGTGEWNAWSTATISGLVMPAGTQTLRLTSVNNESCNFNWVEFVQSGTEIILPPTATAGTTQTITLPTSQVTLAGNGTAASGGTINSHTWTKVSGGAATITDASNYNTTITNLSAGTYVFRLTVTQNDNQTATSDVTLNVIAQAAPTVNAGATQTITLPTNQVTLSGSGTASSGGTITYAWTRVSGPNTSPALNIVSPATASTSVTGLVQGTYVFKLTVTQNDNQTATSNVTINVVAQAAPTASAGTTQTITLPTSQVTLNGSGTSGNGGTITYAWTRVSGPNNTPVLNIVSPTTASTSITGLVQGTYVFRLTVTQNDNQTATSDVTIIVVAQAPPLVNAGTAQTITLPTRQIVLNGSGTAGNGGTITYAWTRVSGPNTSPALTIASPTTASTSVTGLIEGTYVFRLTVTQNDNQTTTSDVTVTVNPAVVTNGKTIPGKIEAESWDVKSGPFYAVATTDAGGGQQVIGINNGSTMDYNVNVTQSGAYTAKFRVATPQLNTQFQVKLGNNTIGTINIPGTGEWNIWSTFSISNLIIPAGNQTLRIVSTNNENCNFNWMEFVLDGANVNLPPTVNAGTSQTITLPASQVTLSGSGTANNGTITSHTWTKVSGGTATITDPSNYNSTVTNLAAGTYVFRLTVLQSDNQTATSDVTIIVNPAVVVSGKTIPGRIEAESWDAKSGPFYPMATVDAGGGQQVVGISNGSWMDYNVNVTQAGTYTVSFRAATTKNNATFQIKSGNTVLGTIKIPNTGEWNNWQTASINNVALTAGNQVLRIVSTNDENCNLNWIEFTRNDNIVANAQTLNKQTNITNTTELSNASTDISPNPVKNQFLLKVNNNREGEMNVEIFDQNARLAKKVRLFKSKGMHQSSISVAGLSQGMYIIKIQMKNWSTTLKMIKQ